MSRSERIELIRRIEEKTNSKLLIYITGDRRGLETKIASDTFPFILQHLNVIGHQEKINLYLYSSGGVTMAGYALVNLIREFCEKFGVIIPFKALSCASLITLGADDIILSKMAQLSPIDPSVKSPLGPTPEINPKIPLPVSVEDVIGYINLVKEQGIKNENSLIKVFEELSAEVHPLILGQVFRQRQQIVFLAKQLLGSHLTDEDKINQITETLYKGRFSHDYIIGRKEAIEIGLNITECEKELENDIIELFLKYNNLLELSVPYNPEAILGDENICTKTFNRAIIESTDLSHLFQTIQEVKRVEIKPPNVPTPTFGYQSRILSENWIIDTSI